ncbi:MAG: VOC family protein [Acidobacteria bacterium]|nr:VOC family protein [Acidobacteriota bacterium]
MSEKRRDHEQPAAVAKLGWRYHHLGVPYTEPHPEETHLEHPGVHVRGFATSPYGIEWMRFEPGCAVPEVIRTVPHVAFEVDDLDEALKGKEILIAPNSPAEGVRVAFILDDGAPVELLQFREPGVRLAPSVGALRFDCIFYYVSDLDRSIEFYTNVLGFRLSSRDEVARFHIDGVLFELVRAGDPEMLTGRGNGRLALDVDDIEAAVAGLRAKGLALSDVHRVSNGWLSFFADPDGNEIVLWQYAQLSGEEADVARP